MSHQTFPAGYEFPQFAGGSTVLLFAKKTNAKGAKNLLTGDKYYQLVTKFRPPVQVIYHFVNANQVEISVEKSVLPIQKTKLALICLESTISPVRLSRVIVGRYCKGKSLKNTLSGIIADLTKQQSITMWRSCGLAKMIDICNLK